jgi:hypothetical protein
MSVSVTWTGLNEFSAMLAQLPDALVTDAGEIVQRAASDTKAELLEGYPVGPGRKKYGQWYAGGNLRAGVSSNVARAGLRTSARVFSTAPHAHLWERGTVARYTTGRGKVRAGLYRGIMPAHRSQSLNAIGDRRRAIMNEQLIDMVRAHDLEVEGNVEG